MNHSINFYQTYLILPILLINLFQHSPVTNFESTSFNGDCSTAVPICELGTFHFDFMDIESVQNDLQNENFQLRETNPFWLEFEAEKAGTLEFIIIPDRLEDDIDFVLYTQESESCKDKTPLRVMASGQLVGSLRNECLGTTGLSKVSFDEVEVAGCRNFSDNFLKPVQIEKGKKYKLLINNFDSQVGFDIVFSSSDDLQLKRICQNDIILSEFQLFPNPCKDVLNVNLELPFAAKESKVEIYNIIGQRVLVSQIIPNTLNQIDVSHLATGQYIIRTPLEDKFLTSYFIKE